VRRSDVVLDAGEAPRCSSADVIEFIRRCCYVPEGKLVGKPLALQEWQKREIREIYDNPDGTRRAILSFGRKNGKTTFAACLVLVHLCGPAARANSQIYSAAQSRDQAAILFALAAKMVRMNPYLMGSVTIKEASKELNCPELGTRYRALSAEVTTAYGLSPALVIHDELGQVRGPRSALYDALETATGAQESPLSVIISTQAPSDNDLLSILIDDALAGHDPRTVVRLYSCPIEMEDPFSEAAIIEANPAYGTFLNEREVMMMARDAKRMPAREAEYRNLILNQRVEVSNPFITPAAWKACGDEALVPPGCEVYAGLDLSEVHDLTALVLIAKRGELWHVKPTFWLPEDDLVDKSVGDRVPYDLWRRQGFLETTPGKTVAYEDVARRLRRVFDEYHVKKLAFDRWNMRHLKPWLIHAGFSDALIAERFVEFGQGMQSMSPALRELEQVVLDVKLRHGNHPVLSMCVSNTIIVRDDAGNRKPSKRKSVGRIDGLVALAMACGVAPLEEQVIDIQSLIA
jgi:phage terminase large subunit-like protein